MPTSTTSLATPTLPVDVTAQVRRMIRQHGQDWVRLNTFFLYGKHLSFYRVARVLDLPLSSGTKTVSKRLHKLQDDLGLKLVKSDETGSMLLDDGPALLALPEMKAEFGDGVQVNAVRMDAQTPA